MSRIASILLPIPCRPLLESLKTRRIRSGRFMVGQNRFAVADGYLTIKPIGFGCGGWFATITIKNDSEQPIEIGGPGSLEVEDDYGNRWRGLGICAKTPIPPFQLVELDFDGKGQLDQLLE
jgi:hypothetical protein